MIDIVMCVFTNLFRIYLILKFIQIFLGTEKPAKWKIWITYSAFFIVNTGLYLLLHLMWVNILCNLLGIFIMTLLYSKRIRRNIFITGTIYIINMCTDLIVSTLFFSYEDGQTFPQIYSVLTVFLIFICEIITEKIISCKSADVSEVQNLPLVLVPLCSIGMILFCVYGNGGSDNQLVAMCVGLLMINFLIFYLYNLLLKAFEQKYQNEVLRYRTEAYANQIDVILQNESQVKTLRHDMKHHLNELKLLAGKSDFIGTQKYIDNMEEYLYNPNELVSTGNIEIDSVLNYMIKRAQGVLKTVTTNITLPEEVKHSFDMNIILGNLLENAIEASEKTEDKILYLKIQLKKGVLRIEIANSFSHNLDIETKENMSFKTTKKEKEEHGIGLKSVKKIVEKYNGIMDIYMKDNLFCVKVLLYMSKLEE